MFVIAIIFGPLGKINSVKTIQLYCKIFVFQLLTWFTFLFRIAMIVIMTDVMKIRATYTNVGMPIYPPVGTLECVAAEEISCHPHYRHVENLCHPCHPSVCVDHHRAVWVAAWGIQDSHEVVVTMECTAGDRRPPQAPCLAWGAVECMKILAEIHLMIEGNHLFKEHIFWY